MAWVLWAEEEWSGANLSPVRDQEWSGGPMGIWSQVSGDFVCDNGRGRILSSTFTVNIAYNRNSPWHDATRISVDVVDQDVMLVGRLDRTTKTSYYLAHLHENRVSLYRVVSGLATWVGQAEVEVAPGSVFTLETKNSFIRVRWDDEQVLEYQDETADALMHGAMGIKCYEPSVYFGALRMHYDDSIEMGSPPETTVPIYTPAPPSTGAPTTPAPTTSIEPTFPPTTIAPTTVQATTVAATTPAPTTPAPTTAGPTTPGPITAGPVYEGLHVEASVSYVESEDLLVVRAWMEDWNGRPRTDDITAKTMKIWSEHGLHLEVSGMTDPMGAHVARFSVPQARLWSQHLYLLELFLVADEVDTGRRLIGMPVN